MRKAYHTKVFAYTYCFAMKMQKVHEVISTIMYYCSYWSHSNEHAQQCILRWYLHNNFVIDSEFAKSRRYVHSTHYTLHTTHTFTQTYAEEKINQMLHFNLILIYKNFSVVFIFRLSRLSHSFIFLFYFASLGNYFHFIFALNEFFLSGWKRTKNCGQFHIS